MAKKVKAEKAKKVRAEVTIAVTFTDGVKTADVKRALSQVLARGQEALAGLSLAEDPRLAAARDAIALGKIVVRPVGAGAA